MKVVEIIGGHRMATLHLFDFEDHFQGHVKVK